MQIVPKRTQDPQRRRPNGQCVRCGAELYPGGVRWRINGQILCPGCVAPWLQAELAAFRLSGGEAER